MDMYTVQYLFDELPYTESQTVLWITTTSILVINNGYQCK